MGVYSSRQQSLFIYIFIVNFLSQTMADDKQVIQSIISEMSHTWEFDASPSGDGSNWMAFPSEQQVRIEDEFLAMVEEFEMDIQRVKVTIDLCGMAMAGGGQIRKIRQRALS